jgi:hypothetical protein
LLASLAVGSFLEGRTVPVPGPCANRRLRGASRFTILLLALSLLAGGGAAAQSLRLEPSISRPVTRAFTIDVNAECLGRQVRAVEALVSFDPALVRLDSITPGAWFTGGGSQYFFGDFTGPGTGMIHFAGTLLDDPSDADATVARCHFTCLNAGQTDLTFQSVDVRDFNHAGLGFGHSAGDLIILDSAVWSQDCSFCALKAIYR